MSEIKLLKLTLPYIQLISLRANICVGGHQPYLVTFLHMVLLPSLLGIINLPGTTQLPPTRIRFLSTFLSTFHNTITNPTSVRLFLTTKHRIWHTKNNKIKNTQQSTFLTFAPLLPAILFFIFSFSLVYRNSKVFLVKVEPTWIQKLTRRCFITEILFFFFSRCPGLASYFLIDLMTRCAARRAERRGGGN